MEAIKHCRTQDKCQGPGSHTAPNSNSRIFYAWALRIVIGLKTPQHEHRYESETNPNILIGPFLFSQGHL